MNQDTIKDTMQGIALTEPFKLAYNYLIAPRDRNLFPLRTVGEVDRFLKSNAGDAAAAAWRNYKDLEDLLP